MSFLLTVILTLSLMAILLSLVIIPLLILVDVIMTVPSKLSVEIIG
jgi:hypothetical protein